MSSLLISELLAGYRARRFSPVEVIEQLLSARAAQPDRREWITRLHSESVRERASELSSRAPDSLPLYGIPFAVKDNIDLESVPTTAGCPEYAYTPAASAPVVSISLPPGSPVYARPRGRAATASTDASSPVGRAPVPRLRSLPGR